MEKIFRKRIGYEGEMAELSKRICREFSIGKYHSNEIITTGYEDFNFFIETSRGKFLVKIFANFRNDRNCKRYIIILKKVMEAKVNHPRILKSKQGYLHTIKIGNTRLRLVVMERIQGDTYYHQGKLPNEKEVRIIAKQAAIINKIKAKPSHYYDSWAIVNFPKEYQEKKDYLPDRDAKIIQPLLEEYQSIPIQKLPHCFVHGDILTTNTILDQNGKVWIIDFSVSNYYPRIQELAVMGCNILFDAKNKNKSQQNMKIALSEYQKIITLTKIELSALPTFLKVAHAMHVLLPNYEHKVKGNKTQENKYWLEQGRAGLKQVK